MMLTHLMGDGFTLNICLVALLSFSLSLLMASRFLPGPLAFTLAFVKIAIPFFYFSLFFSPDWLLQDDIAYFLGSSELLHMGYNPINVFTEGGFQYAITTTIWSYKFLYNWWNLAVQYFLGPYYYGPVFINVTLTFAAAWAMDGILRRIDAGRAYRLLFAVFFLLHWDVISWSSFVNLKDTLNMTLTVITLLVVYDQFQQFRFSRLLLLFVLMASFLILRPQVIAAVAGSSMLWQVLKRGSAKTYVLMFTFACVSMVVLKIFGKIDFGLITGVLAPNLVKLPFGFIRFSLTPQPWAIDYRYSFIFIPTVLHWLSFLFTCAGAWLLWAKFPKGRLFVLYGLLIIFAHSALDFNAGPRQRFQIAFMIAWMQFECFRTIAKGAIAHFQSRHPAYDGSP